MTTNFCINCKREIFFDEKAGLYKKCICQYEGIVDAPNELPENFGIISEEPETKALKCAECGADSIRPVDWESQVFNCDSCGCLQSPIKSELAELPQDEENKFEGYRFKDDEEFPADRAKAKLKLFIDGDFHKYIDNKLAGDFACELVEKVSKSTENDYFMRYVEASNELTKLKEENALLNRDVADLLKKLSKSEGRELEKQLFVGYVTGRANTIQGDPQIHEVISCANKVCNEFNVRFGVKDDT